MIVLSMQYTACIVLFSTLITRICFASLTIQSSGLDESLVEATIEILESCYADRFNTVGIAGPSAESVIRSISSRKTVISTTLRNNHSESEEDYIWCNHELYKLQIFVVPVASSNALGKTLDDLKYTKWWNPIASFLLIESAAEKNGCTNAYEVLFKAWKMKILNAKFICLHQTRGRLIYTFNPYTMKAPSPWRQVDIYEGLRGHNWTLFVRNYDSDVSRCVELDFDKTVDLGGYPIIYSVSSTSDWPELNSTSTLLQWRDVIDQLLKESINALWVDCKERDYDGCDIRLPVDSITDECEFDYPVVQQKMYLITQYRGHRSQLEKLISVLDKPSRFGVLAVLTITLLFFKFWMRDPLIPAILNLVRLICNSGLRRIPPQTAPRIYLAGLFILVVTIQGIYSGKLASLLTKNVRSPTVNSLEDVLRYNLTLHVPWEWYDTFLYEHEGRVEQYFQNKVHGKCADGIAWLDFKSDLIDEAIRYKCHLSRESILQVNLGYSIREDWPLVERVNTVFGRLAASGILNLRLDRVLRSKIRILESYELQEQEPELKPLSLAHLGFAFKILAIGLGLATMVFIFEVATKDWD